MFCSNSTYQKIDQDDLRDNSLTLCWVTQTVQKILWCFVAHISDWLKKLLQCRPKKKAAIDNANHLFFLNIIMNPASKIASTNWIDNKWRETNWKGLVGVNPDPVGRPTTVKNCANSNEVSAFWTENKWTSWRFALLFYVPVHNGVNYSMKSRFFL